MQIMSKQCPRVCLENLMAKGCLFISSKESEEYFTQQSLFQVYKKYGC